MKSRRQGILRESAATPDRLAIDHFYDVWYEGAGHETWRTIGRISRGDVQRFHRTHYLPNRTAVVLMGDVDAAEATTALTEEFVGWAHGAPPPDPPPDVRAAAPPRMRLVHKPGLAQATILWGGRGPSRLEPAREAFTMGSIALGGGSFDSRLMEALRTEGGQTYSVRARNAATREAGHWLVHTSTRSAELASAVTTIRTVTEEFVRDGITVDEFTRTRSYLLGRLPIQYQTPLYTAWYLSDALSVGLGPDELRAIPVRYEALTPEETDAAVITFLDPEEMVWVVVADEARVGTALREFGTIETVYYQEPLETWNALTRTRLGIGFAWNRSAWGPRVSLLHRHLLLAGTYGLSRGGSYDYDRAAQVTLDLHRGNSEYSGSSLCLGATATFTEDFRGIAPHLGLRLFPLALGDHASFATHVGWSLWDEDGDARDLPGFFWSLGLDWYL